MLSCMHAGLGGPPKFISPLQPTARTGSEEPLPMLTLPSNSPLSLDAENQFDAEQIEYNDIEVDDPHFKYRAVVIPLFNPGALPARNLTSIEWRSLGISMGLSWENVSRSYFEPGVLLFRKPARDDVDYSSIYESELRNRLERLDEASSTYSFPMASVFEDPHGVLKHATDRQLTPFLELVRSAGIRPNVASSSRADSTSRIASNQKIILETALDYLTNKM